MDAWRHKSVRPSCSPTVDVPPVHGSTGMSIGERPSPIRVRVRERPSPYTGASLIGESFTPVPTRRGYSHSAIAT